MNSGGNHWDTECLRWPAASDRVALALSHSQGHAASPTADWLYYRISPSYLYGNCQHKVHYKLHWAYKVVEKRCHSTHLLWHELLVPHLGEHCHVRVPVKRALARWVSSVPFCYYSVDTAIISLPYQLVFIPIQSSECTTAIKFIDYGSHNTFKNEHQILRNLKPQPSLLPTR